MSMRHTRRASEDMTQAIAELETLPREALRERWAASFRADPPSRASRAFLLRSLAYRIQEKSQGGLRPRTRKRLGELVRGAGGVSRPAPAPIFKPGTRLFREWKGEVHEIEILERGFAWRGARYDSLSRIAREITGTRWSGPVFFGLRKRQSDGAGDGG